MSTSPLKTRTPLTNVEVWHHDKKIETSDSGLMGMEEAGIFTLVTPNSTFCIMVVEGAFKCQAADLGLGRLQIILIGQGFQWIGVTTDPHSVALYSNWRRSA